MESRPDPHGSPTVAPRRPESEFLPDPYPTPRLPAYLDAPGHQHLVVNPFLAVAALIAWAWLFRRLIAAGEPILTLASCLLLGWVPLLVHYHCADCGGTGLWHRWRQHACPRVIARAAADRRGWLAWPRASTQMVVWFYVLGGATLLIVLVGLRVAGGHG